jgi:hypothetical protein
MASFQYQCTLSSTSSKTAELSRRLDLLPSGFCCSHPRITLVALSRIDIPAASRVAGIDIL